MTPADNGRTRSGAPAARGPMVGVLLLVLSMWTLSCLDASGKWVMNEGVPLLVLSWFRYAVHLLLVLALVLPARGLRILRSNKPREQILRGGSMFLATLMFFTTLSYIPQAEATAINFLAPLLVLSVAPWVLKEPARLSRFIAAGVAFVGVLIVIRPGGGLHPLGTIFGLITACCFAVQFIATRRVAGDDPFTSLIWSGAVGTLFLTLALPFILPPALPVLRALSLTDWALLISTGITGGLGHLFQIAAYRRAPASTLAPFVYLQIISATSVGWLVWGHFPDALTWLGIAIICASGICIGVVEWRRGRAPAAVLAGARAR
ncbi:Predicted permease, DMT superfamily [Achromobacter denitrificans]|uniref:DMT family transporter n=1 Tax=Achromobacter denitrificans TaxID=32002 RepID=UPI0007874905|nr:DMT family transporter [Achromobacter denitrificans]OLU02020.1 EamA family transporter [Achromobacter denitrificans]QKH41365.1 DMT family transporter [Achromobacter denitrificans]QKH51491.1 DMT family transporter [Achromobacter denitrificans]CAB3742238.1 Pseudopaline exporter CntI [Achromobacter denitrificans]SUU26954.1 Predicted permease, DMT superfamily [Achromobacter denitrificans]